MIGRRRVDLFQTILDLFSLLLVADGIVGFAEIKERIHIVPVDIHNSLKRGDRVWQIVHTAVGDTKLGVHVGFHCGPVIQVEKDVLGDTVKLAAKLVEQAQKGQTITSQQTAALLSPELKPYSHELRELAVREQGDGVWLCEIVSQAAATTALVRLTYRDQAVECSREHPSVVIGREYGCGVLVADRTASRKHCTIELRGGQFVVQDHSTNGTYVTIDSEKSVLLKGDDLALRRFGWIGFSDVRYAGSDVVQFSCG